MEHTTAKSSKDEVITAALEWGDSQAQRIADLQERQAVLLALLAGLTVIHLIF